MNSLGLRIRMVVIGASMLRDMRTRFGRSYWGYLLAILWPLTHLLAMTLIFTFMRRAAPIFGENNAIFVATGVAPYILAMYPSRTTSTAVDAQKSVLIFAVIRPLDLMLARAVVETLAAFLVVSLFFGLFYSFNKGIMPNSPMIAGEAILATIYLSISFGLFSAIIIALFNFWQTGHAILLVFVYLSSGIFFPIDSASETVRNILWYNPLAHCVEWLRSAYYPGYGDRFISVGYVIWSATAFLFLALLGERFLRGKLMAP